MFEKIKGQPTITGWEQGNVLQWDSVNLCSHNRGLFATNLNWIN